MVSRPRETAKCPGLDVKVRTGDRATPIPWIPDANPPSSFFVAFSWLRTWQTTLLEVLLNSLVQNPLRHRNQIHIYADVYGYSRTLHSHDVMESWNKPAGRIMFFAALDQIIHHDCQESQLRLCPRLSPWSLLQMKASTRQDVKMSHLTNHVVVPLSQSNAYHRISTLSIPSHVSTVSTWCRHFQHFCFELARASLSCELGLFVFGDVARSWAGAMAFTLEFISWGSDVLESHEMLEILRLMSSCPSKAKWDSLTVSEMLIPSIDTCRVIEIKSLGKKSTWSALWRCLNLDFATFLLSRTWLLISLHVDLKGFNQAFLAHVLILDVHSRCFPLACPALCRCHGHLCFSHACRRQEPQEPPANNLKTFLCLPLGCFLLMFVEVFSHFFPSVLFCVVDFAQGRIWWLFQDSV